MRSILAGMFVLISVNAFAADPSPAWRDVLSTCSEEWRASDTRKNTAKGEGMAAWQTFLTECKTRKGFVPKAQQVREFNRVPDKQ